MSDAYHANFRVPPADQRARGVPGDYRRAAVECDRDWNGTLPGSVGAFEGYLASLPPVIGLGFGGCGDWSAEVDTLIGQAAEIGSACPEDGRRTRRLVSLRHIAPLFLSPFFFSLVSFLFSFYDFESRNSYIEKGPGKDTVIGEPNYIRILDAKKKIHQPF